MPSAAKSPTARAIARSETIVIGISARLISSTASGMATRTAMPSAKVAERSDSTGCPASTLSAITGASFATTPSTGPTPRATPMMSAPFPTGTITRAGGRPSCSEISRPIAS